MPQRHRRCCNRCSVTARRAGGRSNTCRASTETTGARRSDRAQPSQRPGRWTCTSSGASTCRNVKPAPPGCLPGARPVRSRLDFGGALAGPSDEGGFDDVRESLPSNASSSATRRINTSLRARSCSIVASRRASASSSRASRSSSSAGTGSDTPTSMPQTTNKIKSSQGRNQLNSYQIDQLIHSHSSNSRRASISCPNSSRQSSSA